jgi:hypothetical protein
MANEYDCTPLLFTLVNVIGIKAKPLNEFYSSIAEGGQTGEWLS